jgi:hypothetical protein
LRKSFQKAISHHFDNDDNFDLGTEYMEETLVWIAEKLGIPDVPVVHA